MRDLRALFKDPTQVPDADCDAKLNRNLFVTRTIQISRQVAQLKISIGRSLAILRRALENQMRISVSSGILCRGP